MGRALGGGAVPQEKGKKSPHPHQAKAPLSGTENGQRLSCWIRVSLHLKVCWSRQKRVITLKASSRMSNQCARTNQRDSQWSATPFGQLEDAVPGAFEVDGLSDSGVTRTNVSYLALVPNQGTGTEPHHHPGSG